MEERFVLRAGTVHPTLSGLNLQRPPSLDGYVATTLKPGALAPLTSHLGDALLAAWQAGLGRTAVYTGDLGSPWSAGLRAWPDAGALWVQTVRWLSRRSEVGATMLEVGQGPGDLVAHVDLPDGDGPAGVSAMRVQVRTPSGAVQVMAMRPVAPGHFEGRLPAGLPGTYHVIASMTDAKSGRETRLVGGTFVSSDAERMSGPADLALLSSLAALTGGQVLEADAGPFDGPRPTDLRQRRDWFTGAALLLFLGGMMTWPRRPALSGLVRKGP